MIKKGIENEKITYIIVLSFFFSLSYNYMIYYTFDRIPRQFYFYILKMVEESNEN
jgi:hypothetical protein